MTPLMRFKRCDKAERNRQLEWFMQNPQVSPRGTVSIHDSIEWDVYKDGYVYEYVEGECPVRPDRVPALIQFCERELWVGEIGNYQKQFPTRFKVSARPYDKLTYLDHLSEVVGSLGLVKDVFSWFFNRMREITFTPVASCHGDLTLENVVCRRKVAENTGIEMLDFVFIDPGHPRGLPCREMDEAKIMQSLEEHSNRNVANGTFEPIQRGTFDWYNEKLASLPHRVLLASHYLRLLRHAKKHPQWRVEHARKRLEELTQA